MKNLSPEDQEKATRILREMFGGTVYTFHRADGFYPITLKSDERAVANAECNPGTLRVVNEITGKTVWQCPDQPTQN